MSQILQQPECLSEYLPPNTFVHKNDIEGAIWTADLIVRSDDRNEPGMILGPIVDPFTSYEEFGSFVHCRTMARNRYVRSSFEISLKFHFL